MTAEQASDREQEIRARRAAITDTPWGSSRDLDTQYKVQAGACGALANGFASSGNVAHIVGDSDRVRYQRASFIAQAPRDIDTLLAEIDRLRARVAELERPSDGSALPWAALMDDEDLADFLDELEHAAARMGTPAEALADVEKACGTWRLIAEAQHAHNTAAGPNSDDIKES